MPTPPVRSDSTISHFTAGTRQPYSIEFPAMRRTSVATPALRSGVKPRSCISRNATTNITSSTIPRRTNGTPSPACCAMNPPATEPVSIAAPDAIWPRANTASRSPSKPVALSASTSQASTAPEKNVNPSPIRIETTAHAQNGASSFQRRT